MNEPLQTGGQRPVEDVIADHIAGLRSSMEALLAESRGGTLARGAIAVPIGTSANAGDSARRPRTSACRLLGVFLRETTGTTGATVVIREGRDSGGLELMTFNLAANESARDWFGPDGVSVGDNGLYIDVTAGTIAGTVAVSAR